MPDNWWEAAPLAPANDPSFTGFIPGSPKPKEPKSPVFVPKGATQMYDPNTGAYQPIPGAKDEDGKDPLKEAIAGLGLDELLSNIDRARTNLRSPWASGTMGAIATLKPGGGTPRDNFLGNLTAVKGGVITEKLQSLKEASKTGASGFGSLSEKEGALLASSLAALTEDMSPDEYERSFKAIASHALTLRAIRDGQNPNDPKVKADIAAQAAAFSAINPQNASSNPADEVGAGELNPDQKRAYSAFLKANPNPTAPQLKTFLEGLTGKTLLEGNAEAILAAAKKGAGFGTNTLNLTLREKVENRLQQLRGSNGEGTGRGAAFTAGVADTAGLGLADEFGAGIDALGQAFTGRGQANNIGDNYDINLEANRQYMRGLQSDHGGYYGSGQVVGGVLSGIAMPTGNVSSALQAAKVGAGYGAAYGFNSGEGVEGRLAGAGVGALGGGATAAAGSALAPFIAPRIPRRLGGAPRGMAPDVADAAQAEGVDLIRPMVDPASRSDYGALESNVYSQPIIRGAAGRVRGQVEDRVSQLAPNGAAMETGAAGDVLQTAGNRFIQRSRDIKNRLYDRAEKLGGDTAVQTKEAQAQIDTELSQLSEAPQTNAGEIKFLEGLKSDLAQPQTVGSIRRIRSSLRGQINAANLTNTSAEMRALKVLDAAKTDIQRDAPPEAAAAYSRADAFNRERQTHIDTVLKQFLGRRDAPLDSEKAFARLKALASPGGGGRNLAAMMRNLEPDERQDIAATIAQALGRDAPDAPFSTAKFVSQTSKLSPSARRTIFGPDGAQSIDNLRLLSRKLEEAEKDINRSRSATVLERQGIRTAARAFISGLAGIGGTAATGSVSGGVAGVTVAAGAMGASAARRVLSARAMVNPRVSRWLAESADASTPQQAADSVRKLGVIIAREPALAAELKPVQDFLTQRITLPLAAKDERKKDE